MKYIASCSFGKDSLAMVLKLIENKSPLDEVVFYDTGKEFEAIYRLRSKMQSIFKSNDIKYTELYPKNTFDYDMFDRLKIKRKTKEIAHGDGWCGGACRWGTFKKQKSLNDFAEKNITYIGLAIDEPTRLAGLEPHKKSPIAELNMTERDCLNYCYSQGFDWLEKTNSVYDVPKYIDLYQVLDRVSCWCCRNKNLKELKAMYYYFTNSYWKQLKDIQSRLPTPMKSSGSVFELEERFRREIERDGGLLQVKKPQKTP